MYILLEQVELYIHLLVDYVGGFIYSYVLYTIPHSLCES